MACEFTTITDIVQNLIWLNYSKLPTRVPKCEFKKDRGEKYTLYLYIGIGFMMIQQQVQYCRHINRILNDSLFEVGYALHKSVVEGNQPKVIF